MVSCFCLVTRNSLPPQRPAEGVGSGGFAGGGAAAGLEVGADLLDHLIESGERFGDDLGVGERAVDVELHQVAARLTDELLHKRNRVLARAKFGAEGELHMLVEASLAVAVQVDDVAKEVDPVEGDVRAVDAELDVALIKRLAVGGAVAEDFEQADQQRQFVDVGFADVDVALASQPSERRAFAAEEHAAVDFSGEALTPAEAFDHEAIQLGAGDGDFGAILRGVGKSDPSVAKHRAAVHRASEGAFRLLRLLGSPLAETALAFVDPHRPFHVGELNPLVGDAFEVEFAGAGALLLVRAADEADRTGDPFDVDAAVEIGLVALELQIPACLERRNRRGGLAEGEFAAVEAEGAAGAERIDETAELFGERSHQGGANLDAVGPETN